MDDFARLRQAAEGREWNTLQDTLKRLLARMEPIPALEIPAVQINHFLPRFEDHFPQAGWVRQIFMAVTAYASAPGHLPDPAVNQFREPGCGVFVGAVLDMARAVQTEYTVFERYSFMTNAAANAILADLMHFYFIQHPRLWIDILNRPDEAEAETGLTLRQSHYLRFWSDAEVAERDRAAWRAVADLLEQRLS